MAFSHYTCAVACQKMQLNWRVVNKPLKDDLYHILWIINFNIYIKRALCRATPKGFVLKKITNSRYFKIPVTVSDYMQPWFSWKCSIRLLRQNIAQNVCVVMTVHHHMGIRILQKESQVGGGFQWHLTPRWIDWSYIRIEIMEHFWKWWHSE